MPKETELYPDCFDLVLSLNYNLMNKNSGDERLFEFLGEQTPFELYTNGYSNIISFFGLVLWDSDEYSYVCHSIEDVVKARKDLEEHILHKARKILENVRRIKI